MSDLERLAVKVPEAAKMTGLSRAQGYINVNNGEWPSIRLGRAVRVPLDGLREWIARKTEEAASEFLR